MQRGDAVLMGATGLVGGHCLRMLEDNYGRVTAVMRRPFVQRRERVAELVTDFASLDTASLPAGGDIFCALGTTIRKAGSKDAFRQVDYAYPLALARRAVTCGARRFVLVSSVDANPSASSFYLRVKGELEQAITALPFEAVHFFRPSFLMGERVESRPRERAGIAAAKLLSFGMVSGWRRYRPVAATDVAAAMVAAAGLEQRGAQVYQYDEIIALARTIR